MPKSSKKLTTPKALIACFFMLALVLAFVTSAMANPKNKFSDESIAEVNIDGSSTTDGDTTSTINQTVDGESNESVFNDNRDNSSAIESFNEDTEVLSVQEMTQTVSSNSVSISQTANGGSNSCSAGFFAAGACITTKNDNGSGNGGSNNANTGSISFNNQSLQNFGGVFTVSNTTGHNNGQMTNTSIATNAFMDFK